MFLVRPRDALTTYRYLRIAIPILVVMLGTSVAAQVFGPDPDCWLGSISAYYYTAARPVFVASLCAMGACMVIYHGNTAREDAVLNVAGTLAFVVAFVPTPLSGLTVTPAESSCARSNVPTSDQLDAAVDNNMLALLVAASLMLAVAYGFQVARSSSRLPSVAWGVLAAVVVVAWLLYFSDRSFIRDHGHLIAAVTMFGGMLVVVLLNAVRSARLDAQAVAPPPGYRSIYRAILVAMGMAGAVFGVLARAGSFDHTVFWLEAVLTALFGVFWVVQSKELWAVASRTDAAGPDAQALRNGSAG
ncbi:MAG TPA: hypothetical protein VGK78_12000 [Nocardioides sp.]|uniref:hypothetical protein n=1 Tax=Nocardioides sp. TaxID=35761 RepID=UPI002F404641